MCSLGRGSLEHHLSPRVDVEGLIIAFPVSLPGVDAEGCCERDACLAQVEGFVSAFLYLCLVLTPEACESDACAGRCGASAALLALRHRRTASRSHCADE